MKILKCNIFKAKNMLFTDSADSKSGSNAVLWPVFNSYILLLFHPSFAALLLSSEKSLNF